MFNKIIVAGDSIAYGKWDARGGWVERLREYIDQKYNILDKEKSKNMQVFNISVPGEVAPRMAERLESELKYRIIDGEKNLVILALGLNDSNPTGWMLGRQVTKSEYITAYEKMFKIVNNCRAEMIVLGLTPVVENQLEPSSGFSDSMAREFDKYLQELCNTNKVHFVSVYDELLDKGWVNMSFDGIHPRDKGHEIIFELIKRNLEF